MQRRHRPTGNLAVAIAAGATACIMGCLAGCEPAAPPAPPPPSGPAAAVTQPEGWDDELALPAPVDLNPDPRILEIELDARVAEVELAPGRVVPAWTYNGTVPGPLLRAEIGDRVIVHFTNFLPEATTIHWHGLRVPNAMDGAPGHTQEPIAPGESFRYEFVLDDAGTYWYHPHLNSSAQVGWGLYGAILVEDPADPAAFGDDLVLVLSDVSVDEAGALLPADNGGEFGDLFGREGGVLLVNGRVLPTLKARVGKPQRWRVINAARARYYNIRMPGHLLTRIGGDNGLAARSEELYSIVVVPGERADFVFTPQGAPGVDEILQWVPVERGFGTVFNRPREPMLEVGIVDLPPVAPEPVPRELRRIEPIDVTGAAEQAFELTIDTDFEGTVLMGINGVPSWDAEPIHAQVGETQIWRISNQTDFSHPFHLHGYFFQVLDDARIPEWKDTVNVPTGSTVSIAVRFDDRPGMWMYHCHILDHAESGMMGHLMVAEN